MSIEEIQYVLSKVTLIEKLIYSGVTKPEVLAALRLCKIGTQLEIWLESVLKHWVQEPEPAPNNWDKNLKSKRAQRNILRMFENTHLLNATSLKELEEWAESKD